MDGEAEHASPTAGTLFLELCERLARAHESTNYVYIQYIQYVRS